MPGKRLVAAALLAAGLLTWSGCDAGLPAPTPTVTPATSTSPASRTPAVDPSPTSTPAAGTAVSPEATDPVIARLEPGTAVEISFIQMLDAEAGWARGRASGSANHVLKTDDGGQNWRDVTPPEPQALRSVPVNLQRIFFLDSQTGWVAFLIQDAEPGPIEIHFWHTTDGGQSWEAGGAPEPVQLPEVEPVLLFTDPSRGWLLMQHFIGMGHHGLTLLRTSDGGRSWERIVGMPEGESTCFRTGLAFANPANGWMTGECPFEAGGGALLEVSLDGGTSWQALALPPPSQDPELFQTADLCSANSPHVFGPEAGALVVECLQESSASAQPRSFLYGTDDGGASWQTSAYPGGELHLIDPNHGWALAQEQYWTEDGGASWTRINTVEWDGQFSFVSAQLGWAVAHSQDETALVRTSDGGRSWEVLEPIIGP